jgi:hypothetical protein
MQSAASQATTIESVSSASSAVRCASFVLLTGTGFLGSYMFFHALHVAGRDPSFVRRLSAIPFFWTCEAALLAGLAIGVACTLASRDLERLLAHMPKILALTIVLFTLEILLFP